jgi:hypothetical protein
VVVEKVGKVKYKPSFKETKTNLVFSCGKQLGLFVTFAAQ